MLAPKELFYKKLLRRMTWAFAISAVCNVFLFTFLVRELDDAKITFSSTTNKQVSKLPFVSQPVQAELSAYAALDYDALLSLLDDTSPKSDGYTARDCALSALVSRHYFHIDRALGGQPLQKQTVVVTEPDGTSRSYTLIGGLSDGQYVQIAAFAKHELVPYTFEGLFYKLKQSGLSCGPELQAACKHSHVYRQIEEGLNRDRKLSDEFVFQLMACAEWSEITALVQAPYPAGRRAFFEALLKRQPAMAASGLLSVDFMYALHSLDDQTVVHVLSVLKDDDRQTKEYALKLFLSPRRNDVRQAAQSKLCGILHLNPEEETRDSLLKRMGMASVPAKSAPTPVPLVTKKPAAVLPPKPVAKPKEVVKRVSEPVKPKPKPLLVHIVRPKESLWSISRKYKVDVEKIKKANHLNSDRLSPGTALRIPQE